MRLAFEGGPWCKAAFLGTLCIVAVNPVRLDAVTLESVIPSKDGDNDANVAVKAHLELHRIH